MSHEDNPCVHSHVHEDISSQSMQVSEHPRYQTRLATQRQHPPEQASKTLLIRPASFSNAEGSPVDPTSPVRPLHITHKMPATPNTAASYTASSPTTATCRRRRPLVGPSSPSQPESPGLVNEMAGLGKSGKRKRRGVTQDQGPRAAHRDEALTAAQDPSQPSNQMAAAHAGGPTNGLQASADSQEYGPRRGGRRRGTMNFSFADVSELLRLIRQHLPIGQHGWERVCIGYNAYASSSGRPKRDVQSLRTKYYKLVNAKKPTGDPECPPHVREAKHIDRDIEEHVHMGVLNDDDPVPAEWEADRNPSPDPESEEDDDQGDEAPCEGGGENPGSEGREDGDSDGVDDAVGTRLQPPSAKRPRIDEPSSTSRSLQSRATLIPKRVLNVKQPVSSPVLSDSKYWPMHWLNVTIAPNCGSCKIFVCRISYR
ncbi:hypothetical protein C8Q78DRAFT_995032 [Trametes maxima]|nr:hypothetical protein C8Q78DRAFT_995032 [Trametes maxima]